MTEEEFAPDEPPRASLTVVYLGPVAPHWELRAEYGDRVNFVLRSTRC